MPKPGPPYPPDPPDLPDPLATYPTHPTYPTYPEHEMREPLAQTGAEVAIVLTPFLRQVRACQAHTRLRHIIAANIKEYLPPATRVLFTLFRERAGGHRVPLAPGELAFADL